MKRKVIQLAGKTLVVSLPSKWAERYKIKKGDDIEVTDEGSSIRLSPGSAENTKKSIKIDLRDCNRAIARTVLSGVYKQGYDEVVVTYNSKEVYDAVQEKKREVLLGFTIQESGKDKLILGSFTNDNPKEFENSFRRAFLVTISMGENLIDAIKMNDFRNLNEIRSSENTNNQLTIYCERLINKGFVNANKSSFYYVACWNLEKVCDPYVSIISIMQGNKINFTSDILGLFVSVNNLIKGYYNLFYSYDLGKAVELSKERKAILNCAMTIYANKSPLQSEVINHLLEIAALTSNFSGPASALNIDKIST